MKLFSDLISSHREKAAAWRALQKSMSDVLAGQTTPWDVMSGRNKAASGAPANPISKYRSWVYTCANRNAAGLAKANLRLYATRQDDEMRARTKARSVSDSEMKRLKKAPGVPTGVQGAAEIEEIFVHPFLDLFHNVNPHFNQFDLLELLSLFLDLTGDAYWYIGKRAVATSGGGVSLIPTDIWPLQSQYMRIIPDEKNYVKGYIFVKGQKKIAFQPEEIIHFRRNNPHDYWYGMGRVQGAYLAISGYESMDRYEFNQTETNGIKDMLIKYKGGALDSKKRRDLMSEWNHALRISSKERAPMIADMDFDVETVNFSPKELAFLNGRAWHKGEIISAFGQHESMYDKNANTANINGGIYLWEEFEITPTLARVQEKINEQLITMYNEPRLFVAFDSVVDSDRDQDRADYDMLLKYGYPLNRVLEETGRETIDGGDVGRSQSVAPTLGGAPDPAEEPAPKRYSNENGSRGMMNAHTGACHTITVKADGETDIERTGGPNPTLDAQQRKMKAAMARVWRDQLPLALAEVDGMEAKAVKAPQASYDFTWLVDDEWIEAIVAAVHEPVKAFFVRGARQGAKEIAFEFGTTFIERPAVRDAITAHEFNFARAISESSAKEISAQLDAGLAAGESVPELTKRVETVFGGWEKWRAERVARTESARALTAGTETQWAESGVVGAKVWDAAGDSCPFCQEMDGKTVEIGTAFIPLGGQTSVPWDNQAGEITLKHNYEAVTGGDLHPNCRCAIRPKLIEM